MAVTFQGSLNFFKYHVEIYIFKCFLMYFYIRMKYFVGLMGG